MTLRVVFMGTPDFAVPTLAEICRPGPRGRRRLYPRAGAGRAAAWTLQPIAGPSPRRRASALPVLHARDAARRARRAGAFAALDADVAVVVAYGLILPQADPRRAARSAASTCTARCCRAGAAPRRSSARSWPATRETGVMVMQMEEGLDTGPVAMAERIADRARHDRRRAARPAVAARRRPDGAGAGGAGARLARLHAAARRRASPTPTRSTRPRRGSTGRRPRAEVHDLIRGLSPFPGAWFELELADATG